LILPSSGPGHSHSRHRRAATQSSELATRRDTPLPGPPRCALPMYSMCDLRAVAALFHTSSSCFCFFLRMPHTPTDGSAHDLARTRLAPRQPALLLSWWGVRVVNAQVRTPVASCPVRRLARVFVGQPRGRGAAIRPFSRAAWVDLLLVRQLVAKVVAAQDRLVPIHDALGCRWADRELADVNVPTDAGSVVVSALRERRDPATPFVVRLQVGHAGERGADIHRRRSRR